jgi:mannose-6-phosphate isomerase-like protein (cupin superfamily)
LVLGGLLFAETEHIRKQDAAGDRTKQECTDDTYEDDDVDADATVIGVDGSAQTHLHCDEDWVWFWASAGTTYLIRTFNLIGSADTVLELYGSGSSVAITSDDDSGTGFASLIRWTADTDQLSLVRIKESGDSYMAGMGYDIDVSTCTGGCSCDDTWEENDYLAEANRIWADGSAQTHLHCDEDWVWFLANAGATYQIRTFNLSGGADTVLQLFNDYSSTLLAGDDNSGFGLASLIEWTASTDGSYYIRVFESSYSYGSSMGYDIEVTTCVDGCPCPDDDWEDDDIMSAATTVTVGAAAQPHLHCDEDWITFSTDAGATYRIETLDLTSGADTVIELYASYSLVASDDNSGNGLASLLQWTATHHWADVRITEWNNDYQDGDGYSVQVTCVDNCFCSDDGYEENDIWSTATGIPLGSAQIHKHCDTDWLTFQASAGATYRIETYNLTGNADTVIDLYEGSSLVATDDNSGVGLGSLVTWTASSDGWPHVEVTEYAGDYQDGEGYTILVDCIDNCPCSDDSWEDDDTPGTAMDFTPYIGSSLLHYHCDVDWNRFTPSPGATYRIETFGLQGGADTVMHLFGSGSSVLAYDDDGGGGSASLITWTASTDPTLWVKVSEYAEDYRHGERYSFRVDCIADCPCADDGYEENDAYGSDTYIPLGSAQIHKHCDPDWLVFDAVTGATYRIETYNLTGGADTVIDLYASTSLVATDDNSGTDLGSLLTWTAAADGSHRVKVTEYAGDYQPGEGYTVLVDCIDSCPCTDDVYEEDDHISAATIIYPNAFSAQTHYHCDEDWVEFDADLGATYRIETSNLSGGADTVLQLYGSGGLLATDDDGGENGASLITWTAASDLHYWVRVSEYAEDYRPAERYDIRVDCVADCPCTDDGWEENDHISAATVYTVGGSSQTHYHCDEDWVTFNAAYGATYRIQTWNLVGGADTFIDLWGSAGVIASDDNSGGGLASLLTWTATGTGWYEVQITEYADDYQDGERYNLSIDCIADCPCADDGYEENDAYGSDTYIPLGSAQIHKHCDVDWLEFSAVTGATYRVETYNLTGGADTVIDLYASTSLVATDDNSGTGLGSLLTWTATADGSHRVKVTEYANDYQPGEGYTILVDCIADCPCTDDAFEDDDVYSQASTIYVDGATQTHSLCDADWVTFTPYSGATYRIQTWDLVGGADTVIDLFDSSGLITSDDNSGGGLASLLTWTAGSADWHHVRVTEYAGDYEEGKGYKVGITCVADCPCSDDVYEDDDVLADAALLWIGTAQTHQLCDEDWMRFNIVAGAHYQIQTSNLSTGTDTVLELWDSSSLLTSDDNGGGGLASMVDWVAPANGVGYVRLRVQGDAYEAGKQCDILLQCDSGCRGVFFDGFESGDLSAWSGSVP